jgi:hypothetical protein
MQNLCPYKDNKNLKKLPCNWHFHQQDTNIRLCDCGNWYRTDELVDQYQNLPLVLLAVKKHRSFGQNSINFNFMMPHPANNCINGVNWWG